MIEESQYAALQEGLAYCHLKERTLIEVRGADRVTFLHNLCTNDIKALSPGQGCEAFFTNVQGKTLCHTLLFATDEAIWISSDAGIGDALLPHLDKYLIREDVALIDQSKNVSTYVVAGPLASPTVEAFLDEPLEYVLQHGCMADMPLIRIARVPFAAPTAFFVFGPHDLQAELEARLSQQSGTQVDEGVVELARIEAKFPRSGCDVTLENLPQEVSRDAAAISFTKGCYLGQETVARIDALGRVNQHLVQLQFEGQDVPPPETSLRANDKVVGKVTSSTSSPHHEGPLALGYVRREVLDKLDAAEIVSDFGRVRVSP